MQISAQGTINPDGTLQLDDPLPLPGGRVLVIVQPLGEPTADDPFWKRMQAIWDEQKAGGHVPRSVEEVEAERRAVGDEWEERMRGVERIQEECREAHGPKMP
ncbi:MAG TPA: hypothetical protein VMS17_20520 [Gemmataceae bacterium]|nr:hypothetical protein [Gemmataceae bacterium]